MGEYGDSVAVLDLGTAKIKLTVVDRSSPSPIGWRSRTCQFELSPQSATQDDLDEVLAKVMREINVQSVTSGVIVATHAARTSGQLQERLRRAVSSIGPVNVLTGQQEAFLLRTSLDLGSYASAGCEVGGGSVQVVDVNGLNLSVPCGTVTLSRTFGLWLEPDDEARVIDHIAAQLAPELSGISSKCLIVGTTKMATFFQSLREFGRAEEVLDSSPESISASVNGDATFEPIELEFVLPLVRQARPDDFDRIMPSDPSFMFGGHKLLLVILTIARLLHSQELRGSNISTAQILASAIGKRLDHLPLADLRTFSLK